MHKKLIVLTIALTSLLGVIAVTTVTASAEDNGDHIDDDPTLRECRYNDAIAQTPCNRPVVFVDEIPASLLDAAFTDSVTSASGRVFAVHCSHTDAQTLCVLGLLENKSALACDFGFVASLIDGKLVCSLPPIAGVPPAVPAPVPSFTG